MDQELDQEMNNDAVDVRRRRDEDGRIEARLQLLLGGASNDGLG